MKKLICFLLAVVLAMGLLACGGEEKAEGFQIPEVEGFNIGYAREDVTPENGTPMGGYGHPLTKLSTGASHSLYMICIAMSDGEDTVLLYALDLGSCGQLFVTEAEQAVMGYAGIHKGYIPSKEAYEYGCYESQTALFVSGTGEILADKYLELLTSIK